MSPDQNMSERLSRVGSGTAMGNLFRSFWLPAALSAEVADPDGRPLRLRILGEDLVAFRDSLGRIGILSAYCPHRLAPLFLGRNEDCGLRCVYHGWKFDFEGRCMDVPNVEAGNAEGLKQRVSVRAYPAREAGGLVWVYMGPSGELPELPRFEWLELPEGHLHVSRWVQRTNWSQGMEGEIDSSHVSFLHTPPDPRFASPVIKYATDPAPVIFLRETDYGFYYGARRRYEGHYYWRITQWLAPMWSCIPPALESFAGNGRAWVPIDDQNVTSFNYWYRPDRPWSEEELADIESGASFPPLREKGTLELPHGYVIDTFLPLANKRNDYLFDRATQKTSSFSGVFGVNSQDRALQEYMPSIDPERPGIVDRAGEHLVASDRVVVAARRRLLKLAQALEQGTPPAMAANGELYAVRAVTKMSETDDFDAFLAEVAHELRVPDR
jgi:phthalate 4,5-dioxygenase oxygenase subunit